MTKFELRLKRESKEMVLSLLKGTGTILLARHLSKDILSEALSILMWEGEKKEKENHS